MRRIYASTSTEGVPFPAKLFESSRDNGFMYPYDSIESEEAGSGACEEVEKRHRESPLCLFLHSVVIRKGEKRLCSRYPVTLLLLLSRAE